MLVCILPKVAWRAVIAHGVLFFFAAATLAAETASVQVAGFDRFGRHGEIDESVAGRLLITEMGCAACHSTTNQEFFAKSGPNLVGAGVRLSRDWVERFIADPANVKPGTTMPHMLGGRSENERAEIAASIADFLTSLREPIAEVKGSGALAVPHQFWLRGDADRGRELFHQVGCVACHAADPNHETAEIAASPTDQLLELLDEDELADLGLSGASRPGPVQSLGDPAAKYSAHSLTSFLLNPETVRPSGRMPNLKLLPTEAADIAAYLIRERSPQPPAIEASLNVASPESIAPASIARGRDWFTKLRCNSCHSGTETATVGLPATTPLDRLGEKISGGSGCVAPHSDTTDNAKTPHFIVDDAQRAAMVAAIGSAGPSGASGPSGAHDQLQLSMLQLNCLACHQRDSLGGVARDRRAYFETVGNADLGDEGRLPPPLSHVEHKLQPAWLSRVLQGSVAIRPHMHVRMPKLPGDAVKRLSSEFASVRESVTVRPQGDPKKAWPQPADVKATDVGRLMMDSGCVQCHSFRGEALPGVIGVVLSGIGDRMQPQWFLALLRDPGTMKPRTRMPNFFPDGVSQHPDLLGGDRDRQIAAMWGYLTDLAKQPLPAKIEEARSADYELRPVDRPIILRTFMRDAGTRAIAVGFPDTINIAVDASQARLAAVWRGRFLDAQGTWFIRAAPPADPLGDSLMTLSGLPSFLSTPDTKPAGSIGITTPFRGYRLDDRGVPTFQYRFGSVDVDDTIEPDGNSKQNLVRRLVARPTVATGPTTGNAATKSPLIFRMISGQQLRMTNNVGGPGNVEVANEAGWRVIVSANVAKSATMRTENGVKSWLLPIDPRRETKWELRYAW
ncbi:MAG TPA: cytochrome oxidase [Planctomycetaceae bacterium]|nr:cytochrome oxidase [Planctomycetaceae bacterium]